MVIKPVELWFSCGNLCIRNVRLRARVLDLASRPGPSPSALVPQLPVDVRAVYAIESDAAGAARRLRGLPGALRYVIGSPYDRRYIEIQGTFDAYLAKFSGKARQTWRRKVARFSEVSGGPIAWKEYRRSDEMAEFQRFACQVVPKTYQKKLYDTGLGEEPEVRAQLERDAAADEIRGYVLFLHDRPIAYHYCYAMDDILHCSKLGYDPAYGHHSPGTVLFFLMLQALFSGDRFRQFDFGRGEFAYKEHYATRQSRCIDVFYFRKTAANLALVTAHLAIAILSKMIGDAFAALGLKQTIKRAVQNWTFRWHQVARASPAAAMQTGVSTASVPQRITDLARAVPGLRLAVRALRIGWVQGYSEALDRWYRVRSTVLSGSNVPQFGDDNGYEPAKYPAIRTCLRRANLSENDVFFDIGCGMGRVLCMAARHPVRKCVGVEYVAALADIAERNANMVRGRKAPVEIWVGDATEFDYAAGTVFFLYNPFREATMRRFIEQLQRSLAMRPRPIRIIYMAPRHEHVLHECSWLTARFTLRVPYHVGVRTKAIFWDNAQHLDGSAATKESAYASSP